MEAVTEKVYVEVPKSDLALLESMAQRMEWNIKTREEIMKEVGAVRYGT